MLTQCMSRRGEKTKKQQCISFSITSIDNKFSGSVIYSYSLNLCTKTINYRVDIVNGF